MDSRRNALPRYSPPDCGPSRVKQAFSNTLCSDTWPFWGGRTGTVDENVLINHQLVAGERDGLSIRRRVEFNRIAVAGVFRQTNEIVNLTLQARFGERAICAVSWHSRGSPEVSRWPSRVPPSRLAAAPATQWRAASKAGGVSPKNGVGNRARKRRCPALLFPPEQATRIALGARRGQAQNDDKYRLAWSRVGKFLHPSQLH